MEISSSNKPRRLGRGIGSLMQAVATPVAITSQVDLNKSSEASAGVDPPPRSLSDVVPVPLLDIQPSQFQPRRAFDQTSLQQLADSIKHSGLMQPIIVRPRVGPGAKFELVAGERRWRAASLAGLATIPALVRTLNDEEAAEWGLVENVQREDLNPMDRAHALRNLQQQFGFTQEQLGTRLGLDRASIANLLRLCDLEDEIASMLRTGKLSGGHGRALLAFPKGEERIRAATMAAQFGWSVRKIEQLAKQQGELAEAKPQQPSSRDAVLRDLERQLGQHLGTKVTIAADKTGARGRVVAEFYGIDHFDGLLAKMGMKHI